MGSEVLTMTIVETGFSERAEYLRGKREGAEEERRKIIQALEERLWDVPPDASVVDVFRQFVEDLERGSK